MDAAGKPSPTLVFKKRELIVLRIQITKRAFVDTVTMVHLLYDFSATNVL